MLLTELALQNVAGLPGAARLPLKAGLNALVSREADVVKLLAAVLFPSTEPTLALCAEARPCKAAVTIVGRDGYSWRVVRDLVTGSQSLLQSDPATKQARKVSEDPAEIARVLAGAVGFPPEQAARALLLLAADELPSRIAQRIAAASARVSIPTPVPGLPPTSALAGAETASMTPLEARTRLPTLREELARAEALEVAQDELYELQNRFGDVSKSIEPIRTLEARIAELDQKMEAAVRRAAEVGAGLEGKVRRYPEAQTRRDAALAELAKKRQEAESALAVPPDLRQLASDPFTGGGLLGAAVVSALAVWLGMPTLFLLNLVALGVAAFGVWQWVSRAEEDEHSRRRLGDLGELEKRIQKQYELDTQPVLQAMKAFGAASPEELLQQLEDRDLLEARKVAAQRELDHLRSDPRVLAVEQERARIEQQLRGREAEVNAMGFSRDASAVRRELALAEELCAGLPDEDPLPAVIERSAALLGVTPPALLESFKDRLAQYLSALTNQRFIGVRALAPGRYHVVAANNAAGPITGLSPADQDLIYVGLRIGLAERVAGPAKVPVFFDEPSLLVDAAHRGLFVKMLKSLGAVTQVVVRAFDAPPAGAVDHVAQPGGASSATHAA